MQVFEDKLYFSAQNQEFGKELWVTDGTENGTNLIKDINKGSDSSNASDLASFDNKLFFSASDGVRGKEVWVSDGNENGTQLFRDINKLRLNAPPRNLTAFNDKLFFTAGDDQTGTELWVSDGTENGTKLFKDIFEGIGSSNIDSLNVFNNKLFFRASDGGNASELWVTDGTQNGTFLFKDINRQSSGSFPSDFTIVTFTYTVGDRNGVTDSATVILTVQESEFANLAEDKSIFGTGNNIFPEDTGISSNFAENSLMGIQENNFGFIHS